MKKIISYIIFSLSMCSYVFFPLVALATGTWTERQPNGNSNFHWNKVHSDTAGTNLVAIADPDGAGNLFISSDGGVNWNEAYPDGDSVSPGWYDVAIDGDGSNLIAAGAAGVYVSVNGGSSWTQRQPAGEYAAFVSVDSDDDGSNLMVTTIGPAHLYTSSDGGLNWTERKPTGSDLVGGYWGNVSSDADGSVLAVALDYGRMYMSVNSGVSWSETQPAGNTDLPYLMNSIDMDAAGTNLVVSGYYYAYTSTNGGSSWTQEDPAANGGNDTDLAYTSVAISSDGLVVLIGSADYDHSDRGTLWSSPDSGVTWQEVEPIGAGYVWSWRGVALNEDGTVAIASSYMTEDEDGGRLYTFVGSLGSSGEEAAAAPEFSTYMYMMSMSVAAYFLYIQTKKVA